VLHCHRENLKSHTSNFTFVAVCFWDYLTTLSRLSVIIAYKATVTAESGHTLLGLSMMIAGRQQLYTANDQFLPRQPFGSAGLELQRCRRPRQRELQAMLTKGHTDWVNNTSYIRFTAKRSTVHKQHQLYWVYRQAFHCTQTTPVILGLPPSVPLYTNNTSYIRFTAKRSTVHKQHQLYWVYRQAFHCTQVDEWLHTAPLFKHCL
jgi:hypothetical protein